MATAPIGAFVYDTRLVFPNQRPNVTAGTNTVIAGSFVKLTGSSTNGVPIVSANATSDTTTYGFTLAPGQSATAEPYTAPQGTNLNPVAITNTEFVINTVGAFTPTLGLAYDLAATAGVPYINSTTAATFFRVQRPYPDDFDASGTAVATNFQRYICTVVATQS